MPGMPLRLSNGSLTASMQTPYHIYCHLHPNRDDNWRGASPTGDCSGPKRWRRRVQRRGVADDLPTTKALAIVGSLMPKVLAVVVNPEI